MLRLSGIRKTVLITSLLTIFALPVFAQSGADPVLTAIESVAGAAGRLLPAAIETAEAEGGTIAVAVGAITHEGSVPRLAEILRSVTEEELLSASAVVSGRGSGQVVVVDDPLNADIVVQITSSSGVDRILFSIQYVDVSGRIRVGRRLDLSAGDELLDRMEPAAGQMYAAGPSGDDTPDIATEALRVEPGNTVAGRTLEVSGDRDWYTFAIDEAMFESLPVDQEMLPAVRVYTTGTTDTYIELYGPGSPDLLAAENDDYQGANASVTVPVETVGAQYWVEVRGFADSSTGPYDLVIEPDALIVDSAEPNDSLSEATPVTRGILPVAASLRPMGDADWYYLPQDLLVEFAGPSSDGGQIQTVAAVSTMGDLDTVMRVFDSNGTEIAYNDDGGESGNARVVVTTDMGNGDGLYFEVSGYGDRTEGDYAFVAGSETITLDRFEPDNDAASASPVEIDASPQRRTFSSASDADWIRLDIAARQMITVETYGDIDTYMTLYDEQNAEITSSDDDGYGLNARIEQDFGPGTYFIEITPLYLNGPDGEYSVDAQSR